MRPIYAAGTKHRLTTWSAALAFATTVWSPVTLAFECPGAQKAQESATQTEGELAKARQKLIAAQAEKTQADQALKAANAETKLGDDTLANNAVQTIHGAADASKSGDGGVETGTAGQNGNRLNTDTQTIKNSAAAAQIAAQNRQTQAMAAYKIAENELKAAELKAEESKKKAEEGKKEDKQSCQTQCSASSNKSQCEQQCQQQCFPKSEQAGQKSDMMKQIADALQKMADKGKQDSGKKADKAGETAAKDKQDAKEAGGIAEAAGTMMDHADTKLADSGSDAGLDPMKLTDPLGDDKSLISNNLDGSKDNIANLLAGSDLGAGDPNKTNDAGMAGFKGGTGRALAGALPGGGNGGGLDGGSGGGAGTGAATDNGSLISGGFEGGGLSGGGGLGGLPGSGDPVADTLAAISSSNFDFGSGEEGTPGEPDTTLWQKTIQAYQYMDHKTLNPLPEGKGRVMALRQHYISIADKKGAADGIKIEKGSSGEAPIQQASAVEGRALASPDKEKK